MLPAIDLLDFQSDRAKPRLVEAEHSTQYHQTGLNARNADNKPTQPKLTPHPHRSALDTPPDHTYLQLSTRLPLSSLDALTQRNSSPPDTSLNSCSFPCCLSPLMSNRSYGNQRIHCPRNPTRIASITLRYVLRGTARLHARSWPPRYHADLSQAPPTVLPTPDPSGVHVMPAMGNLGTAQHSTAMAIEPRVSGVDV